MTHNETIGFQKTMRSGLVCEKRKNMKPSHYIQKIIKTRQKQLKLAFKVLDMYLSTQEVDSALKSKDLKKDVPTRNI